ncbi:hypothetical protein [Streptomyces antimycoticus]|uniref:hypothetical protein n=1 Tax=Streptomyces antimycoticus TaxID=68175 RepID=UPI000A37419A|nr:hypothetical protein [Streptomyces antimycoticus]
MNEPTPIPPYAPAVYLAETQQQITAPTQWGTAPLPPLTTDRWLWHHLRRIVPAVVPTAAWALATAWHEQLPAGSLEPLWLMGVLTALAGAAGVVAAAKRHGSAAAMKVAFGSGAAFGLIGIAAWTPHWPVRLLMWVLGIAAAYGLCVPHWRQDRREETQHQQAMEMEQLRGFNSVRETVLKTSAAVEIAHSHERAETARVEQIVAASDARVRDALLARETRVVGPGAELDVKALLKAAGHQVPEPDPVDVEMDIEALWHATADAPHELPADQRRGEWLR